MDLGRSTSSSLCRERNKRMSQSSKNRGGKMRGHRCPTRFTFFSPTRPHVSRSPFTPTPTSTSPSSPFAQAGRIGLAFVISTNRFSVLEDESTPPTPLEPLHSTPASGLVDVRSTSSFPSSLLQVTSTLSSGLLVQILIAVAPLLGQVVNVDVGVVDAHNVERSMGLTCLHVQWQMYPICKIVTMMTSEK